MINLNNRDELKNLDSTNLLGSIEQLPEQIADAHQATKDLDNHHLLSQIDNVVVAGMGGSALGATVIKHLAQKNLTRPMEIVNDYQLPGYVNEKTLVLLSSYSGTTEETLACAKQALGKNSKIAVITSGGDLAQFAKQNNCPHYLINPKYNPSNQPRMAIGYSITGQIGLLSSFGLLGDYQLDIQTITTALKTANQRLSPESTDNPAVKLAHASQNKIIFIISAEHLKGAAHVVNNQINENAKNLTVELNLPELNHHYMEGLPNPTHAKETSIFWFIDSDNYSQKLQLRIRLTIDVITQNGYQHQLIKQHESDLATEAFLTIQLGSFANFYLSMLNNIDPAPIPWVDYFKSHLK
jgi:glucose/mannose-6-phosphate isomerase